MNKNLLVTLIFLLVLVALLWIMPNIKVEAIGDFFEKIITPVALPLSLVIAGGLGLVKYHKWRAKKKSK